MSEKKIVIPEKGNGGGQKGLKPSAPPPAVMPKVIPNTGVKPSTPPPVINPKK